MSGEFEIRHFDNRVKPGSDLRTQREQNIPTDDDPIAVGTIDTDYGYQPGQSSNNRRMASYQHDSPNGSRAPSVAGYDSPGGSRTNVREPHGHGAAAAGNSYQEVHDIPRQEYHREPRHVQQQKIVPARPKQETPLMDFEQSSGGSNECCGFILYIFAVIIIILTFPVSIFLCVKIVQEYERAVIFRLGRVLPEPKGPGMFFIVPCLEEFKKVDLRTLSFDVPPQEILTKDSVTVSVDAVVYWRVDKPLTSIVRVANAYYSTMLLAQTTLRNILGTKELREVLSQRDEIVAQMQTLLDEGTDPWGIQVERVEVKDVRLPVMLQRAMAKEAESTREAHAKVIAAEGEKLASRSLSEAAKIISENPSALQLRYLQTLNTIATEKQSTIFFPLPINGMGMAKKLK